MHLQNYINIFYRILEHIPIAISVFNCDMDYVATSHKFLTDFGLDKKNLFGRSHYQVFPELSARWKEVHQGCLLGVEASCEFESLMQIKERAQWVRWKSYPWFNYNDEIGGIVCFTEFATVSTDKTGQFVRELQMASSEQLRWLPINSQLSQHLSDCTLWGGFILDTSNQLESQERLQQEELRSKVEFKTAELQTIYEQMRSETLKRQQLEEALYNSEARFRRLMENLPGVVYQFIQRVDGTQYFSYMSLRCLELYELEPEEFMQNENSFWALVHEEDREAFEQSIVEAVQNLRPWRSEYRIITPSGQIKWVQAMSQPQKQANGEIFWDGFVTEITERKLAEAEKQLFVSLVENSSDFVAIAKLNTETLYINQAGLELVGLDSLEQYRKTHISDYHTPKDWEFFQREILPNIMQKGCWRGEFYFRHFKTGASIPIDYNVFVVKDVKTGQPLALATVTRDITELKQTEIILRESEARYRELARREQLLNRLARQIRESLNLDTVLQTAIQEIRDLLQIDICSFAWFRPESNSWETVQEVKSEFIQSGLGCYSSAKIGPMVQLLQQQEIVRIDDIKIYNEPIHKQFLEFLGYQSEIVLPVQTHSCQIGVIICGHLSNTRTWTDGEVELLKAVADQVAISINQAELYTQARQAAEVAQNQAQKLEKALQELKRTQTQLIQSEKMSGLGQLVAGVAHEINNPVNFIYGNLAHANTYIEDLLSVLHLYQQTYPETTVEIREEIDAVDLDFLVSDLPKLMNSMRVGSERIRGIVQSLRVFSRLDEAEMKSVDIREGIESTLMILQHRLKSKQNHSTIEVIKQYAALPMVVCYPGQLNQVFMNLLVNAIDALEGVMNREAVASQNARVPTIVIRTEVLEQERVAIHIVDNGTGMSPEVQRRLFDPFFTTKPVGVGTGLGLSISYQIVVDKHHGQLHCLSELNQGTEFIIEIPITQRGNT